MAAIIGPFKLFDPCQLCYLCKHSVDICGCQITPFLCQELKLLFDSTLCSTWNPLFVGSEKVSYYRVAIKKEFLYQLVQSEWHVSANKTKYTHFELLLVQALIS